MKINKFTLGILSKYRKSLMGLSIFFVVSFHYYENLLNHNIEMSFVTKLFSRGNLGVDVFLFLSGIGLYYSYLKNNDKKSFWKKRFKRIIIPYLIISIPFWLWKDILIGSNYFNFIKNLFFINFFLKGDVQLWYVITILFLYIIYPYMHEYIYKDKSTIIRNFIVVLLCSIILPFVVFNLNFGLYNNIEIALTRIPIFVCGCYIGSLVYENKEISMIQFLIFAFCILLFGILKKILPDSQYSPMIDRYFGSTLAILGCVTFGMFLNKFSLKKVKLLLDFLGDYTFEIYMTHVLLITIFNYYKFEFLINGYNLFGYNLFGYTIIISISIFISIVVNKLYQKIAN